MLDQLTSLLGISNQLLLIKLLNILFLTITVPLLLFWLKRVYDESVKRRERRREIYAEALAVCLEFKEYAFAIYRRGKKDPEAERLRISSSLLEVQKRIAHYDAWLMTESVPVSQAYTRLVKCLRKVAGGEMKKGWNAKPITKDSEMTIGPPMDWSELNVETKTYVKVVRRKLAPWWNIKQKLLNR